MDSNPFGGLGVKLSGLTEWTARYLEKFSSRQLLALACAAGLLASVVIYLFLAGAASEKRQVANSSTVAVVVAKENIPQRSIIQDSMAIELKPNSPLAQKISQLADRITGRHHIRWDKP